MHLDFGITFDYLCPWARNANEHVVTALRDNPDWNVQFVPYSLSQGHVDEGDIAIWDRDRPWEASGILALLSGVVVRDQHSDRFLDAHVALFAARHDHGHDIREPATIAAALDEVGLDGSLIVEEAMQPQIVKQLATEHEAAVRDHVVWGVPTFIGSERSVFLRVLDRPEGEIARARARIEQIVGLVEGAPELHEFKQTDLAR